MPNNTTEHRKLAAIMFTDMVGYSALAQKNEALALELLEEHRRLVRPLFASHSGREIKTVGDAFMVEFASPVEAVRCAIAMQKTLAEYNHATSPERQLRIRIGVHLGDVVHRDGDVYGDGVNIAARIEPLAEPGGICVTQQVYDHVHNKLETPLLRLGQGDLKNIQSPVNVYRVALPWEKRGLPFTERLRFQVRQKRVRAGALVVLLMAVVSGNWFLAQRTRLSHTEPRGSNVGDREERIKSLALLPLTNLTGDTNQQYFVDGMTEVLNNYLSNLKALRVPSRTTMMHYPRTLLTMRQIASKLNVDWVLEGSVQRDQQQVVITVELIDAVKDKQLMFTNYHLDLPNTLKVQSEAAQAIVAAIQIHLSPQEKVRLARARTVDPAAFDAYFKGRYEWNKRPEARLTNAIRFFSQAIDIDPTYAVAYAGMADAYTALGMHAISSPADAFPKALAMVTKALELDPDLAEGHTSLAVVKMNYEWDWQGAEREFRKALSLSEKYAHAHHMYSHLLTAMGRSQESLQHSLRALELEPLDGAMNTHFAWHYLFVRDNDAAINQAERSLQVAPTSTLANMYLGLAYLQKTNHSAAITALLAAPSASPECLPELAYAYAVANQRGKAQEILDKLQEESKRKYVSPFFFALIYAGLGEKEPVFEWLEKAYKYKSVHLIYLKEDPQFEPFRTDQKFTNLVRKIFLQK